MIVDQGYSSLTMRALARDVGMKLASLQYHFKTTDDLIRAVVGHIDDVYAHSFSQFQSRHQEMSLREVVRFVLEDEAGTTLSSDRLWPQLWAMQQVEPLVSELVEEIYARYLEALEASLSRAGSSAPRAEALCLMSMLEGTTLFVGEGRRWEKDAKEVHSAVMAMVENIWGRGQ